MIKKEHTLLTEVYRPQTLETFVGSDSIKETIQKQLDQNDIQNMLFFGKSGCGKTTLAKLIVNNLECASLILNASDERGIETIRDKVTSFASAASFQPQKVVVLDEADFLTIQAQASLRNVIEKFSRSTRFILTCNYIERIIDPLQSRCQTFKIVPPSKLEIAKHLKYNILDVEGIIFEPKDLKTIINKYYPDLRKTLNTIQSSTVDNKLKLDTSVLVESQYQNKIIELLKSPKTTFRQLRQVIADSNANEFSDLYRELYDNITEYANGREGEIILYIEEYMHHSSFVVDKEICISACLNKILNTLKQKQIL